MNRVPEEKHLSVSLRVPYHRLGELGAGIPRVWVAFHGYGQLSRYFVRKFAAFPKDCLVIVPQGLSKFYLGGTQGRVGASWMTKEDRLTEIDNQYAMLDAILERETGGREVELSVLGFSQGVVTACRWLHHGRRQARKILLWAGQTPAELLPADFAFLSPECRQYYVFGTRDPYFDPEAGAGEALKKMEENMSLFPAARRVSFPGKHEVDAALLASFA